MALSSSQKIEVERHLEAMSELFAMTPENDDAHGKATLVAVSKMLMTLAGRESGELAGAAKGEAYMAALEDIPCWAVEEAVRRWYRGECGLEHDYRWSPAPAVLRKLAKLEEYRVRGTSSRLRNLITAVPPREFSETHCVQMRDRLRSVGLASEAT